MRKAKWIILLCGLLAAGSLSDYCTENRLQAEKAPVSVTVPFQPQYTCNPSPQSSVDLTAELTGLRQFQKYYGTNGSGQKIALLDSGIDLGHPVFQKNEADDRKVAVYRDYTEEGRLKTKAAEAKQGAIIFGETVYQIGSIPNNAERYRLAFLNLQSIMPRMQLVAEQQMAVLVTAQNSSFYNCVYLDTNQNCDFTDEQPLYHYAECAQHIQLSERFCELNLALTDIKSDGKELQLTADTLGHGTFLAGLIAGDGDTYQGLAFGSRLYVYKIFNRDGQSSQQKLAQAIGQAVQDDVDCINLSLSIPKDETICEELKEALNKANMANIPVIAAAGNLGPGKNTITWPARDTSVIAAGSYGTSEQYLQDRGIQLQDDFIADYSGRGSTGGSDGPLLVASAGMISSVPGWYSEDYLYDYGTSISAAVTTAAVCHIQEAAEKQQRMLSIEQIKNLLAGWAKDLGYSAAEQGYGALRLGRLPKTAALIKPREGKKTESIVYSRTDPLIWNFSVPQGQSQSWYIEVPKGCTELSAILQMDQQLPENRWEHIIAMGRCYISIYSPDGVLMDQSPYLGAAYGEDFCISGDVGAILPQAGIWEIVITSADNLSQYQHQESTGTLKIEVK